MACRARIWKKIHRWVSRKLELSNRVTYQPSDMSRQVGKLLKNRGSEIITMTTL